MATTTQNKLTKHARTHTQVWDIQSLSCVRTLTSPQRPESCCVWQELVLVGVEEDGKIRVYDAAGECVQTLREHSSAVLALVATDDLVVSASYDGSCKVWTELDGEDATTSSAPN